MHDTTVRSIRNLQSSRRQRNNQGLFFIEGVRHFVTAVDCGARLHSILYSSKLLTSAVAEKLVRHQRRLGVPVSKVSPEAFRSISTTDRASGVAAVVRQDVATLDCVDPIGTMFWIVLESVRSSGNLGTLLRTSAAVGGSGFIMLSKQIDPYNPAVVRSSMGALFRQRYVRTDLRQLWHWVRDHHLQLIGVSPGGDTCFTKPMYHRPTLIALGNERTGLSESVADRCHATVRIPMLPETDSLNLGAAGALMMYEVARKNGTFERLNQPEARGSAGRRPP